MSKKMLNLTEIIIVILILSILALIVLPNVSNWKEEANQASISTDIKVIQQAVDKYKMDHYGLYPIFDERSVPTVGKPEPIDFYKLKEKYLKKLPKQSNVNYWVDENGKVWGSTIDAPKVEPIKNGELVWTPDEKSKTCSVYEYKNNQLKLKQKDATSPFSINGTNIYLVGCEDQYGFETPPVNDTYQGILTSNSKPQSVIEDVEDEQYIFPFDFSDTYAWKRDSKEAHGGSYSFTTTNQDIDNSTSTLNMSVNGPSKLNFWYKVSSEEGYDEFYILLDGKEYEFFPRQSGEIDWTQGEVIIPNGSHTITFVYEKDISLFEGQDTVYLDDISLTYGKYSIKPKAVITMIPNQMITTTTRITWDYQNSLSYGDTIVNAEWQGKQDVYPQGGSYTVRLRVQNSQGIWSDWEEIQFYVFELAKVKQISAGAYHTVALLEDGTVKAWGENTAGQLGDGTQINRITPVTVLGLKNVKAIATGHDHTIALLEDGTVKAWGSNSLGQLGDGTTAPRPLPVTVQGLNNVKAISAGYYHNVALLEDGTVKAWGDNFSGELGDGTNRTIRTTPVTVQGLNNVKDIVAGYSHTVALLENGTMKAWGYNGYGELGDGTTIDRTTPVTVQGLNNVKDIAVGWSTTYALLEDGTVKAWGNNSDGQLGDGTYIKRNAPVTVQGLSNAKAIAAGLYHAIALLEDGTVKAWGDNKKGELGDGTTISRSTPVTVQALSNVKAIDAGIFHTVALLEDGTVKAWGRNVEGQLGDGTTTNRSTPITVQILK